MGHIFWRNGALGRKFCPPHVSIYILSKNIGTPCSVRSIVGDNHGKRAMSYLNFLMLIAPLSQFPSRLGEQLSTLRYITIASSTPCVCRRDAGMAQRRDIDIKDYFVFASRQKQNDLKGSIRVRMSRYVLKKRSRKFI